MFVTVKCLFLVLHNSEDFPSVSNAVFIGTVDPNDLT